MIGHAKAELEEAVWTTKEGVICPVCNSNCKVYKMPLTKCQISMLFWLRWKTRRGEYIHFNENAPRVFVKSASVGKMKHWGLIEQAPNVDDPTKNKLGYVRITDLGLDFIEDKCRIAKYVFVMNDMVLKQEGSVTRRELHPEDFDLSKLMQPARAS